MIDLRRLYTLIRWHAECQRQVDILEQQYLLFACKGHVVPQYQAQKKQARRKLLLVTLDVAIAKMFMIEEVV